MCPKCGSYFSVDQHGIQVCTNPGCDWSGYVQGGEGSVIIDNEAIDYYPISPPEPPARWKCTCDMVILLRYGCKCGGI